MQKTTSFPSRAVLRSVSLLCFGLVLAGCSFFHIYKADLDQGNVITREMADKLKPGMTQSQVRYVLGTPLITDTLNPQRWDYLYSYTPGTYALKAGLKPVKNRRLTVWFEHGVLARVEGVDQMPISNPAKPESKDLELKADPL
jgi:outer membrane protein assembly factor BamE